MEKNHGRSPAHPILATAPLAALLEEIHMSRPLSTESLFRAIADPTRRRILDLLLRRDLPAAEIARQFDARWPTVSAHLRVLLAVGLVTQRRRGRNRIYRLNSPCCALPWNGWSCIEWPRRSDDLGDPCFCGMLIPPAPVPPLAS
jgi:DNA-binding transcriptional ArsR family regulator